MDSSQNHNVHTGADQQNSRLNQLPGKTTSAFLILLIQAGFGLSLFFTAAYLFMTLLVWVSGPEMSRGISSGLLGIPSENFTEETLLAMKSVYIRTFLFLALISGLFAITLKYMIKLVRQGRDAASMVRNISSSQKP